MFQLSGFYCTLWESNMESEKGPFLYGRPLSRAPVQAKCMQRLLVAPGPEAHHLAQKVQIPCPYPCHDYD